MESVSMKFADTWSAPYYAVIFTSEVTGNESAKYIETSNRMLELAQKQPGYLGVESTRDPTGFGITISYWKDRGSILNWKRESEHLEAQSLGKSVFYSQFKVRVTKVERDYVFDKI